MRCLFPEMSDECFPIGGLSPDSLRARRLTVTEDMGRNRPSRSLSDTDAKHVSRSTTAVLPEKVLSRRIGTGPSMERWSGFATDPRNLTRTRDYDSDNFVCSWAGGSLDLGRAPERDGRQTQRSILWC